MTRDAIKAEPELDPEPGSYPGERLTWKLGHRSLDMDRPRVMAILNLTPDSFSDGGELPTLDRALERAESFVSAGADILDVGGESTRPGAPDVDLDEERNRILPFIREAADRFDIPISVDTRKVGMARWAVDAGATIVNDVSGLTHDPEMAAFVADAGVGIVLMHMRGTPETMESRADYVDVTGEVVGELLERVDVARKAGIADARIVLDPGIGFAKTADQSLTVLRDLRRIVELGFPVLVGPSRKSFLGAVLGVPAEQRLEGTLAACAAAHARGARIFRVHDVEPAVRLLKVLEAVRRGGVEDAP
ncbi:MAG: dihydropteroate synthase [Gemmatimonadota bacterium]